MKLGQDINVARIVEIIEMAITEIRKRWHYYTEHHKVRSDGTLEDYTSADTEVQALIVEKLIEAFPGFGINAEEKGLRIACTLPGINAYFTVDSIDGTIAFKRQQAFGVGTQIALVIDGEVVCVAIGDVNSGNLYWYGPDDEGVLQYTHGKLADLQVDVRVRRRRAKPLSEQVVVLWKSPEYIKNPLLRRLIMPTEFGGAFLDYHIIPGSIALRVMRVLTAEIGAHLVYFRNDTPWDNTPLIGMTKQLKIAWLQVSNDGNKLERFEPRPPTEVTSANRVILLIPEEKLPELLAVV